MNIENYKYIRSVFIKHGEKLKFKMGQSISDDRYLSGSVYFIEEGTARVIYKEENKFKTIKKYLLDLVLAQSLLLDHQVAKILELQQNYWLTR